MDKKQAHGGRPKAEDTCIRVMSLLKLILQGGDASVGLLMEELMKRKCRGVTQKHIKEDVRLLAKAGWPVSWGEKQRDDGRVVPAVLFGGATLGFFWEASDAAKRLDKQMEVKNLLARSVVDDLQAMDDVKWVILGSGTTVRAVAKEMFARYRNISIEGISTANVFVLQEYIRQRPQGLTIEIPAGTLDWDTACLLEPSGVTYQQGHHAELLITSFSGLAEEGFQTKPFNDVAQKERELNSPGTSCRSILIPLEWKKIGEHDRLVRFPADVRTRKYVLYTDKPEHPDKERVEIIEHWQTKLGDQLEVRYVTKTPV